jgi:hypothetical protein
MEISRSNHLQVQIPKITCPWMERMDMKCMRGSHLVVATLTNDLKNHPRMNKER